MIGVAAVCPYGLDLPVDVGAFSLRFEMRFAELGAKADAAKKSGLDPLHIRAGAVALKRMFFGGGEDIDHGLVFKGAMEG